MDIRTYYIAVILVIILAISSFSAILYQNAESNRLYQKCLDANMEIAKLPRSVNSIYSRDLIDCTRR